MRSLDMICPPTEDEVNNSTELEENTSAINKLIEKLEEKIVINQFEEQENDNEDEESEDEHENE